MKQQDQKGNQMQNRDLRNYTQSASQAAVPRSIRGTATIFSRGYAAPLVKAALSWANFVPLSRRDRSSTSAPPRKLSG